MTLLEWRDSFRTGIEEVDHEHRELIRLVNDAYASVGAGADGRRERTEECLGEIYARISAHFALEEKAMAARAYPQLAPHKADHEGLLDDIREVMDEQVESGVLDGAAFGARLAEWFGGHFRTHDASLHRFLRGLADAADPAGARPVASSRPPANGDSS
jgi:hemerythrin-like metal-binding protein